MLNYATNYTVNLWHSSLLDTFYGNTVFLKDLLRVTLYPRNFKFWHYFVFFQCHSSIQFIWTVNCLCVSSIKRIIKCRNENLYVSWTFFPAVFELTANTWGNWLFVLQHLVLCHCNKKSGRQRLTWQAGWVVVS